LSDRRPLHLSSYFVFCLGVRFARADAQFTSALEVAVPQVADQPAFQSDWLNDAMRALQQPAAAAAAADRPSQI
jgi:hypothetical protein